MPLQLSKFDLFLYQIFNSVLLRREQPNNTGTFRGSISVSHPYHMVEKVQKDKTTKNFVAFLENLNFTIDSFKEGR